VDSIWGEVLGSAAHRAFDLMAAAVRDCTDELWRAPMWDATQDGDDPRHATPWAISWHALERLDFMRTVGFEPWEIWPGFEGRTGFTPPPVRSVWEPPYGGLDITTLSEPWSRADILEYVAYCRRRMDDTLANVTDDRATTRIGRSNETYAARLVDKVGHVIEHGSQIRQFITAAPAP
jgi:hypothetical protein